MNIVIVDSDALIALIYQADSLHEQAMAIKEYLKTKTMKIFIPYPIVLEAATALARIINRSDLAAKLLNSFVVLKDGLDTDVADEVAKLYKTSTSKKNTPFDHYVLALAKKNNIEYIFSFDSFYKKNGLILAEELVK